MKAYVRHFEIYGEIFEYSLLARVISAMNVQQFAGLFVP